jgi:hypothetical protein
LMSMNSNAVDNDSNWFTPPKQSGNTWNRKYCVNHCSHNPKKNNTYK